MSPYRTPALPEPPVVVGDGFAFPHARVRIGADRFAVSFWDPVPLVILTMGWGMFALGLGWRWALASAGLLVVLGLTLRVAFVVTRAGSWVEWRFFGVCWRRKPTGRWPMIENDGWGWSEIAVVPSEVHLRKGLHDDQRAVLADWGEHDARRNRDAVQLIALMLREIGRLHA